MGGEAVRALLRHQGVPDLENIVLDALAVPPPELRPEWLDEDRRLHLHPLNSLYGHIVKWNVRLRKLVELNAPEVIIHNSRRMLQKSVDSLFERLADELRFVVDGLVQKATDYSARGVVVPDAALPPGSIGVPAGPAMILCRPQVIRLLTLAGYAETIKAAEEFLDHQGDAPAARQALADALGGRPLLAISEAHRVGPLQPLLCEGEALRLHPQDGARLGLRFDGDGLMLHLPLSGAAARELSHPQPCQDVGLSLETLTPQRLVASYLKGETLGLHLLDRMALGVAPWTLGQPPAVKPRTLPQVILKKRLAELGLSDRSKSCLESAGLTLVGELLDRSADELLKVRNVDMICLHEVQEKLAARCLFLRDEPAEVVEALKLGMLPLGVLELGEAEANALEAEGVETVGELVQRTAEELLELLKMPYSGKYALQNVREQLAVRGLKLKGE
jgi:hypothetical protein